MSKEPEDLIQDLVTRINAVRVRSGELEPELNIYLGKYTFRRLTRQCVHGEARYHSETYRPEFHGYPVFIVHEKEHMAVHQVLPIGE